MKSALEHGQKYFGYAARVRRHAFLTGKQISGQKHFGSSAAVGWHTQSEAGGKSAGKNILAANRVGCQQVALFPSRLPRVRALHHRDQC
jgi:hypothetical protein